MGGDATWVGLISLHLSRILLSLLNTCCSFFICDSVVRITTVMVASCAPGYEGMLARLTGVVSKCLRAQTETVISGVGD